jgi:hypothetical protein
MKTLLISLLFFVFALAGNSQDDKKIPEKKLVSGNTSVKYDPAKKPERKLIQKKELQQSKDTKPAGTPEKKLVEKKK